MEKELLVKVKFFACYWGQKVFVNPMLSDEPVSNIYVFDNSEPEDLEQEFLMLKPIAWITREECALIASFVYTEVREQEMANARSLVTYYFSDTSISNWEYQQIVNFISEDPNILHKAVDYLRSCGYALPYMGFSVSTLVKWGWIKLK